MIHLVTTAIGRPEVAAACWPHVRAEAGTPVHWTIAIDGEPSARAHAVARLQALAAQYADSVIVAGSHVGSGAAFELARAGAPLDQPLAKLDADLRMNPGWLAGLLDYATRWDDGSLGMLAALSHARLNRADVGPRRMPLLRITTCLFTPRGLAALGDTTTVQRWGGHGILVQQRLQQAHLWYAYCQAAYIAWHDSAGSHGAAYWAHTQLAYSAQINEAVLARAAARTPRPARARLHAGDDAPPLCTIEYRVVVYYTAAPARQVPTDAVLSGTYNRAVSSTLTAEWRNGIYVPYDIAVVGDEVWICNQNSSISRLLPTGESAGPNIRGNDLVLPYAIEVIDDVVWIADTGGTGAGLGGILRFNLDTTPYAGGNITGNGLNKPTDIVQVGDEVWVCNYGGASVSRFGRDGTAISSFTDSHYAQPRGIALFTDEVWMANGSHGGVDRISTAGSYLGSYTTPNYSNGFLIVDGVAWTPLYAGTTIYRYNHDGTAAAGGSFTVASDGIYPYGLAVVGSEIWVACQYIAGAYMGGVIRLNADGTTAAPPIPSQL